MAIVTTCQRAAITCVHSDPQSELKIRFVPHFELLYRVEEVQTHVGYLCHVPVTVPDWKTTHHHVGISDCLDLVHVMPFHYTVKQAV